MKLDEYIVHLQSLQEQYAGLDIEIVQRHPRMSTMLASMSCQRKPLVFGP
jgi:hypothetical protein